MLGFRAVFRCCGIDAGIFEGGRFHPHDGYGIRFFIAAEEADSNWGDNGAEDEEQHSAHYHLRLQRDCHFTLGYDADGLHCGILHGLGLLILVASDDVLEKLGQVWDLATEGMHWASG